MLTKLWGRMARRDDRGFDFTYSKLQKGRTAEIYFSAKAVKRKLAELKAVLPPEVYDFPAHTPADEMAVMLPLYQQLADANGRQQVSNGATSTLGLGLELGSCSSTYVKATFVASRHSAPLPSSSTCSCATMAAKCTCSFLSARLLPPCVQPTAYDSHAPHSSADLGRLTPLCAKEASTHH